MSWHKVSLSVDQVADGEQQRLHDQFDDLFMAAKGPEDMAMFSGKVGPNGIEIFFSPGSFPFVKALIDSYAGTPCQKPDPKSIVLMVGHANAKTRLL